MYVVACFQWVWQCRGYTDIQGLVAALRILGLRGQFLDWSPVYSEPGSLIGNTESHLSETAESVHCIAELLPHKNYMNKPKCPMHCLPTPHRLGASCLLWRCPARTVSLDESPHHPENSEFLTPCLALPWGTSKVGSIHTLRKQLCSYLPQFRARTCCQHLQLLL
jgi:hypothetical protein